MKYLLLLCAFSSVALAADRKPAGNEACFKRIYRLGNGKSLDEGFQVKLVAKNMEEDLIVIPLNAEVRQVMAEADQERAKICLEGTRTSGEFLVYGARKE